MKDEEEETMSARLDIPYHTYGHPFHTTNKTKTDWTTRGVPSPTHILTLSVAAVCAIVTMTTTMMMMIMLAVVDDEPSFIKPYAK